MVLASVRSGTDGLWEASFPLDGLTRSIRVRARDAARGEMSGDLGATVEAGGPAPFVVLSLHSTVAVVGTVVDEGGIAVPEGRVRLHLDHAPATGPDWRNYEGNDVDAEVTADHRGRFRIQASPFRTVRAAACGPGESFGPPVWKDLGSDGTEVDLGNVTVPGVRVARWTLRFVDEESRAAVPGTLLRAGPDEWWEMTFHDGFATSPDGPLGILAGTDGVVHLSLACRPDTVFLAAGSPSHASRVLALDCRSPGEFDLPVPLRERPGVVVRLLGPTVSTLLESGAEVRVDPPGGEAFPPSVALDLLGGTEVRVPAREYLPPAELLEGAIQSRSAGILDGNRVEVRSPVVGDCALRLVLDGATIARTSVRVEGPPGAREEEWRIPAGRVATINWTRASAWLSGEGRGTWLSRYGAWIPDGGVKELPDGTFGQVVSRGSAVWSARGSRGALSRLWVPEGASAVAFGFLEAAKGDAGDVVVMAADAVHPPDGASPWGLDAPLPYGAVDRAGLVLLRLCRSGVPLQAAGVPVRVYRLAEMSATSLAPVGECEGLTDGDGTLAIRLFPGRYGAEIPAQVTSAATAHGQWISIEVTASRSPQRFDLELTFGEGE